MRPPLVTLAALASGLVLLLGSAPAAQAAHGYDYFVVGNPADVATPAEGLANPSVACLTSSRGDMY